MKVLFDPAVEDQTETQEACEFFSDYATDKLRTSYTNMVFPQIIK